MRLYHGTNCNFDKINLSVSHNKRDFGKGFYLTTDRTQAEEWAGKMMDRYGGDGIFVYEYEWNEKSPLKYKSFEHAAKDWLLFVKENRIKGGIQHNYDVVRGKVADDTVALTISLLVDGTYTVEETISRLEPDKLKDLVSFHTEKALDSLTFIQKHTY
ncbi:MAG: DUF3990 domain-containing protein [Bacteroidales bacterium]|jgi:hypothetical protein|nr:DUF3990 domain-containing protein [Bacteroidales bacterium]